jgi:hypothetical protein
VVSGAIYDAMGHRHDVYDEDDDDSGSWETMSGGDAVDIGRYTG